MRKGKSEEEIRSFQEIKNSQDCQYNINQRLNALHEGINSLSLKHEKLIAKSESDRKQFEIDVENLRDSMVSALTQMNSKLGEIDFFVNQIILRDFQSIQKEIEQHLRKDEFFKCVESIYQTIMRLDHKLTLKNDNVQTDIGQLKERLKLDLENLKSQLTPSPPEVDPIKAQLDERFAIFKVDFDGLIKEIALLKKAVTYDQKKFENIYTLIGRLKEGKT